MSRIGRPAAALLVGLLALAPLDARESNGTPAARALVARGEAAVKVGNHADAAAAFRKAIEADPDFVDAHQRFIETTQRLDRSGGRTASVRALRELYERWATRNPKRAAYQWALGFLSEQPEEADRFFNKALLLDPEFARAHMLLARNADVRGDWDAQRAHLKAAVEANPDAPRYLLQYAQALKRVEPARFQQLALEVVRRFPATETAAEALYRLANASSTPEERRAYFERLRAEYPLGAFSYTSSAMYDLYDEVTTPAEALLVAQAMAKQSPSSQTWARRVALQDAMARAHALVAARKFSDAMDLLESTERPSGAHAATWTLLKVEAAAGAGQAERAYDTLVDSAAAAPYDRVDAALVTLGAALGKTRAAIDADVWRVRDAKAVPAAAFQLPSSAGGASVQLSDYRGRVILIAFWFPG